MFIIGNLESREIIKKKTLSFICLLSAIGLVGRPRIHYCYRHSLLNRIILSEAFSLMVIMLIFIEWLLYVESGLRVLYNLIDLMNTFIFTVSQVKKQVQRD